MAHEAAIRLGFFFGILALVALIALTPVRSSDEKFLLGMALFVIVFLAVKTLAHSRDR